MGIVDEDIARVRAATDITAIIGEQVALRRVGNRLTGLCPFHSEKSPSFSVNAAEGLYYCFGCQARGDAITFVRETQHLDFAAAVEYLAGRCGVQLRYDDPGAARQHHRRAELTAAMEAAVEWFHARLNAPDGGAARHYLRSRGYDSSTVRQFKLGWAPDEWDALSRSIGFPADVLKDCGLGFRSGAGRQMDAFRGRVMLPIFDAGGKPVAFGGRILPGAEGPKYKNSQEGPLYSKRRILYGLNWAKADVVRAGEVIVCEGYTDVIAFHRAGIPRAVATCGTALADEHMALLKNFARRIILAYDADAAGQGAAERFYAWEQKLELDISVLALPAGEDPGSATAPALVAAVEHARPFLGFRIDRVLAAADPTTAEGRARATDHALEAIAGHPNDLVRDQYVMQVADWARLPPDRVRERLNEILRNPPAPAGAGRSRPGRRPGGGRPGAPVRGERGPAHHEAVPSEGSSSEWESEPPPPPALPEPSGVEAEALRLAVHRPQDMATRLEPILFDDPAYREAFTALLEASTLQDAIEAATPPAAHLLLRLAVEEPDPSVELDDVVAMLVRAAALRQLGSIEAEARARQEVVNLAWATERIQALGDPNRRVDAAGQLVAWLCGETESHHAHQHGEEDG